MATQVAEIIITGHNYHLAKTLEEEWLKMTAPALPSAWVLIVAGGLLQVPAVRAAHELGYKVLLTDRDPDCACASLVEEFVQLDTFDVAGHVELARTWRGKLAAVFTCGADPVVTVAAVAEAAGCRGLPMEIAQICADKDLTRFELDGAGYPVTRVPQPHYMVCSSLLELTRALKKMPCQTIVKAISGSGSRGHTRIDTLGKAYDLTWIDEVIKMAYKKATAQSGSNTVLLEELLAGIELSVETLWHNGVMFPLNAVERPFREGTCIELGHYNPAQLSQENYQAVWDIMRQAGNAIGMNNTRGGYILKGDLILTDDGPKVLELTPRLSGGFDSSHTSPASRGVNYIKGALRLALGQTLEQVLPDFLPRWHRHSVCLAVFSPQGRVTRIQGVQEAQALGCEVILRYNVGDDVPELVDCTQRAAFVIAMDDTQELAMKRAEAARGVIVYEVE